MPDYSKMSDEELMKIAGNAPSGPAAMSDADLLKIAGVPEASLGQNVSDAWQSFQEGIPGAGLVKKAARATAAGVGTLMSDKPYGQIYSEMTKKDEEELRQREARSPKSTLAGSLAGSFIAPNPASIAGRVGLNVGDAATRAENFEDLKTNAGIAGAVSAGAESLPYVGKILKAGGSKLTSSAEKVAEKATGATGKQAERFAENAGRELLDQGVVKAFYSPEKIAGKAGKQLQQSYDEIDTSLKALDKAGAFVSKDDVIQALEKEASKLPKGPSGADARARLAKEIEETKVGPDRYSLTEAELEKRTYQHQANYDVDESVKDIKRKIARSWKEVVEKKATDIDPKLAETFKTGKLRYSIFEPIEVAAAKRASTLNQSPYGGLLDMASVGAGFGGALASEDPSTAIYGVGLAALRRGLAPRLASTAAVATDAVAKGLNKAGNARIGAPGQMAITRGLTYPGQNQGLQIPRR